MQRKIAAAFAILVLLSSFSVIYAFAVTHQFGANLSVTSPLAVFSEGTCTTPYGSTINLGSAMVGALPVSAIFIKNLASVSVRLQWNSTLRSSTNNKILDQWIDTAASVDINGEPLPPNGCFRSFYQVNITTLASPGSYTWTVTLGYT